MFLKKLAGRTDLQDALQRLENVAVEENRMTTAEAFKAVLSIKDMIQALTDLLQSVDGRVKDLVDSDKVIKSAQTVHFSILTAQFVYMVRCREDWTTEG